MVRSRLRSRLGHPLVTFYSGAGQVFATASRGCGRLNGEAGQEELTILVMVSVIHQNSWAD